MSHLLYLHRYSIEYRLYVPSCAVTCRMSVFKSLATPLPPGRWRIVGRDRASGPPNPDFPSLFTSLLSTSGLTRPFLFATWRWIVSPPGATSSGHHGHGARIQITWMALRSTCLHLKGCRSSLAIHRRCLVLGRRHHLCRRRRHHHHLCRRRRHHLLPCHRRRLFHLHLRLSWPGYRSSAWMRPPPSRARKARACRMPLCAACERSRHQLRLSCRRHEH